MKNTEKKTAGAEVLPTAKQAISKLDELHAKAIRGCCQKIIDKIVETGRVYLDLCLYIRSNTVEPKLVSTEMAAMGFNRQVISRVNKVANASDELFSQFEARTIGFNKVLELSRGGAVVSSLAAESGEDVIDVAAQIEEMESQESKAAEASPVLIAPTTDETIFKNTKAFESAASRCLSMAAALEFKKQKKVVGGNGYVLVVMRDKKWKPAPPKSNPNPDSGTME